MDATEVPSIVSTGRGDAAILHVLARAKRLAERLLAPDKQPDFAVKEAPPGIESWETEKANGLDAYSGANPDKEKMQTRLDDALGNEANNTFAGWTALAPQTLVRCAPEPGSLSLLGMGLLGGVGLCYRRRQVAS